MIALPSDEEIPAALAAAAHTLGARGRALPERIGVKLPLVNPRSLDRKALIPVFHRWIQDGAIDGLLLDVHDYTHVPDGPGVILIAHEGHVRVDEAADNPGLEFERKRQAVGGLLERLRDAWTRSVQAAVALEADTTIEPAARFRTSEVFFRFPDRLAVPVDEPASSRVAETILELATLIYDTTAVTVRPAGGARTPLTVRVETRRTPDLRSLGARLGPPSRLREPGR
jgi:hypothetical protein